MYCDQCGQKSSEELDQVAEGYSGVYYCSEECREKANTYNDEF